MSWKKLSLEAGQNSVTESTPQDVKEKLKTAEADLNKKVRA